MLLAGVHYANLLPVSVSASVYPLRVRLEAAFQRRGLTFDTFLVHNQSTDQQLGLQARFPESPT
jgi:hypothetical protein